MMLRNATHWALAGSAAVGVCLAGLGVASMLGGRRETREAPRIRIAPAPVIPTPGNATHHRRDVARELTLLAIGGDDASIDRLLAMSDEPESGVLAVQAMGKVSNPAAKPKVMEKLRAKLAAADVHLVCAALGAFGQVGRGEAVPELAGFIHGNWARPDGHGPQVCAEAVKALGKVRTQAATAAMIAELERVGAPDWLPDHGSVVVAELAGRRSSEVRAALAAYAEGLSARMPGPDNPPGRKYYEEKIAEVDAALAATEAVITGVKKRPSVPK